MVVRGEQAERDRRLPEASCLETVLRRKEKDRTFPEATGSPA